MKNKSLTTTSAPHESAFTEFSEKNRSGTYTKIAIICGVVTVILVIFIVVIMYKYFPVKQISVDGVGTYDYETILEKSGVSQGSPIFFVSAEKVENNLTSSLAFIKDVDVELELPSSVHITIYEEEPAYYFELEGEYFLITDDMKILSKFSNSSKLLSSYPDVMYIKIPDVSKVIVSQKVVFADDSKSRHTDEALKIIRSWERYDKITEIDFSNRFELTVVYENRITAKFGSFTDFSDKIELLESMIDYYPEDTVATFLLHDVEHGVARVEDEALTE